VKGFPEGSSAAARAVLGDRPALALALEESGVDPNRLPSVLKSAQAWIERLASRGEAATALGELIERVRLSRESLHLPLKLPLALTEPDDVERPVNLLLSRLVPMQMKRRGVEMRIVLDGGALELISGQVNWLMRSRDGSTWINARCGGCCGWASCRRGSSRRSPKATSRPISRSSVSCVGSTCRCSGMRRSRHSASADSSLINLRSVHCLNPRERPGPSRSPALNSISTPRTTSQPSPCACARPSDGVRPNRSSSFP
jgi:hypothetical protein